MSDAWAVVFSKEAQEDYLGLDGSIKRRVTKALLRVSQNPLPTTEGGYGKPLANKDGTNLSGLLKIKLKAEGIRIVYKLERTDEAMHVIVVGVRADNAVYREAARRLHNL